MIDILFVQPYDRPWDNQETISRRSRMYMNRAMFEVGYMVPAHYSLKCLDLNVSLKENLGKTTEEIVEDVVLSQKPKLVLVSFPSYAHGMQVLKIVRAVNNVDSGIRIILGGSAISLIKDAPIRWEWPITGCYDGFGMEITRIIKSCFDGSFQVIPGMYWKNLRIRTKSSAKKRRLVDDYTPSDFYSARKRFAFRKYLKRINQCGLEPMGILEMTRGCKNNCSFCAINKERLGCFTRNPRTVVKEAYFLASRGLKYLHLIDPTFGIVKNETAELLALMTDFHKTFPNVAIEVLTRSSMVTKNLAELLEKAGVIRCGIGMETMEPSDLTNVNKRINSDSTRKAVANLAECGIEIKLFHILFPGRISTKTIEFLLEISKKDTRFIVQSSFLRKLPNQFSCHEFLNQDQTVFSKGDAMEQVMEWMLANIAFNSMDMGSGDENLQKEIANFLKKGGDLRKIFKQKNRNELILGEWKFIHTPQMPMYSCIERG